MTDRVPSRLDRDHPELLPPGQDYGGAGPFVPGPDPDEEEGGGLQVGRILAALRRFKWLLVAGAVLGAGGAYYAYRSIEPEYRVEGAIWVNVEDSRGQMAGPIAQSGLLEQTAWIDLLKSYAVLDPVVVQEQMYLQTANDARPLFQDFRLAERFAPGQYVLEVAEDGSTWTLRSQEAQQVVERGEPGDSVGGDVGFLWAPDVESLEPGRVIRFSVVHPRDAARRLSDALQTQMDRQGNFIRLNYTGTDPERIASILQSVMERHVSVAAELKKGKLDELTVILQEQLTAVQAELEAAENQLESFRVNTVTLPTEESAPIAPGIEQTRGPVFTDYFNRRLELDAINRDLERLSAVLDSLPEGGARVESFELIPAVSNSSELQGALEELTQNRAELRSLLQDFTGDYPPVEDLQRDIRELETETLPRLTASLMAELRARRAELQRVLDERSGELREIPRRTIQEARLERRRDIADNLYVDLRQRFETAQLAAASSIPDVRILDETQVPSVPASDQRLPMAGMVFLGFLGAGIAGAVLWDRMDPRFRYVTDVSHDLGIEILGVVPRLKSGRNDNASAVFEAFRDIRMRTEFAHGTARPIVVTVTSPDTGEGKTFVSSNLAIAFAQLGQVTLLIDGDTRRGDLHQLFDDQRKPGLTDLLEGRVRNSVIRGTAYENLDLLPSGSRRTASPELLSSSRMQQALAALKSRYDVIIVDSPPMSAGSDAFVLGAHAGNLIVVMRSGTTNKELAKGKLETFLRLPVRMLGGVLNDIQETASVGYFRHYTYYLPDYVPEEEEDVEEEKKEGREEEDETTSTLVVPEDEDSS